MKKAITLIEVLVAIAIFSFIAVAVYSLLGTGISVQKRVALDQSAYQGIYLSLERMAQELRNAIVFTQDSTPLKGTNQGLEFYTIVFDYQTNAPVILYTTYSYENDTLIRTTKKLFSDEEEKKIDFLEEIKSLEFSYFDGQGEEEEWQEVWEEEDRLPTGIKIKLSYKDERGRSLALDKYVFIYTENSVSGGGP